MMSEIYPTELQLAGLAKDPTEVILMALIFDQQKRIKRLVKEIEKMG